MAEAPRLRAIGERDPFTEGAPACGAVTRRVRDSVVEVGHEARVVSGAPQLVSEPLGVVPTQQTNSLDQDPAWSDGQLDLHAGAVPGVPGELPVNLIR